MSDSEIAHRFDEQRTQLSPYGLTCVRWEATQMTRPDRHNEIELNYLESGSVTYLLSGRRVTVRANRLAAFWAIVPHQIIAMEGSAPYYVATIPLNLFLQWKLPAPFLSRILAGELLEESTDSAAARLDPPVFQQWIRDLETGSEELMEITLLEMHARMRRMAITCAPAADAPQRPALLPLDEESSSTVERMAAFVAANYRSPIRIADVAGSAGLHPDYASTLFRKAFGMTPGRYILEHRISHAQRMLSTTSERISVIAFESGFNSISRFNAAFRSVTGTTPRQFRARQGSSG